MRRFLITPHAPTYLLIYGLVEFLISPVLFWHLGGRCPVLNNLCENNPCPEGMECVADPRDAEYSCVCPEGKKGKCSGKTICDLDILTFSEFTLLLCLTCTFVHPVPDGHSLTFSGNGYVKYHLMENENKELMKLSLRLRTFSSHATVMYAKGTDYSILEVCANLFSSPIFHSRVFFPPFCHF